GFCWCMLQILIRGRGLRSLISVEVVEFFMLFETGGIKSLFPIEIKAYI
ncbi:MAG: hypothetical protein ACI83Q_000794, partial [Colwellia polaris]